MKILLTYISGESTKTDSFINLLPTGLCYLHAVLREAGYNSTLANFSGYSETAIQKKLRIIKPDIIGISQWTHNRHSSINLAKLARIINPDILVVFGGGHATFTFEQLLNGATHVDIVAIGEAEKSLPEIVNYFEKKDPSLLFGIKGIAFRDTNGAIIVTESPEPIENLDVLPHPACYFDNSIGINPEKQAEFIVTARGCPYSCSFCSSPAFWNRRIRFRSPESIVDEIMYIRDRYGLIYFSLRDDTFTADRTRTIKFCQLMIERRICLLWNCQSSVKALDEEVIIWMKRAGCECIQLGIESGSPRILNELCKPVKAGLVEQVADIISRVGINLSVYLISDIPGETEADFKMTVDMVTRIKPDDGYLSPLAYYPGTKLFNEAKRKGLIAEDIFEKSREPAIYAVGNPNEGSNKILKAIVKSRRRTDRQSFVKQKKLLGYCYTTNVLAGDWYRQQSDDEAAEKEYLEITTKEIDNPWGWFLLAELHAERGDQQKASEFYVKVLEIVPENRLSKINLGVKI